MLYNNNTVKPVQCCHLWDQPSDHIEQVTTICRCTHGRIWLYMLHNILLSFLTKWFKTFNYNTTNKLIKNTEIFTSGKVYFICYEFCHQLCHRCQSSDQGNKVVTEVKVVTKIKVVMGQICTAIMYLCNVMYGLFEVWGQSCHSGKS